MAVALRSQRGPYFSIRFLAVVLRDVVFFANAFGWRRSGNTFLPVERFHSSYWSSVILLSTSSCANFRRCALLLKGIKQRLANAEYATSTYDCLGGNRMAAASHRRRLRLVSEPSTVSIIDPVASDPRVGFGGAAESSRPAGGKCDGRAQDWNPRGMEGSPRRSRQTRVRACGAERGDQEKASRTSLGRGREGVRVRHR